MSTVAEPGVRTRTFSWQDPAATAASGMKLAGIDYIRAIAEQTLPPPPIYRSATSAP